MADTMTLEQVLIEVRIVANNGCMTITRENCAEWADAIDVAIKQRAQDAKDAALLEWAARRWRAEVMDRPLVNVHRRPLDDVWRQVIRHAGGDDVVICGPRHDDLVVMAKESGR